MITEDYVSFEVAKLLKENGFVIPYDSFRGVYINGIFKRLNPGDGYGCNLEDEIVDVCSLQLAMKWLREVHKVYMYIAHDGMENTWFARVYNDYKTLFDVDNYSTYEEACEAAIRYSLENLI